MTPMRLARLAATTLSLGALAIGITAAKAPSTAKIEKLLAKGDTADAVAAAEARVAAAPTTSGDRAQLARAYLQAGRFASAEAAFADVLTIDPSDGASALKLALVKIALGKGPAAREVLEANRNRIGGADYGLAVALSGDVTGGVGILEAVTRAPGADAKARQNLALAYALEGKWLNARVMAAQDLAPAEADGRMVEWMNFVRPSAAHDQVAALLGVTPAAVDPGQPVALAFARPVAPVAAAAQAVPPAAVFVPQAPLVVPAIRARSGGRYVVQLGAFGSDTQAAQAWHRNGKRLGVASYAPSSARIRVRNVEFVRLSVGGFANRAPAVSLCERVRHAGGVCFVRPSAGDQIAAWFRPGAARFASR